MPAPVILFTDFGAADIYVGQLKAALLAAAPEVTTIDLLHDAPAFNVAASAHLLAACCERFPAGSVFLAVVDPGVGGQRDAVAIRTQDRWLVGPDNGLLSVAAVRSAGMQAYSITWRPTALSASFHGRDLFAPVAARLTNQTVPDGWLRSKPALDCCFGPQDRLEIIYVDHYGNAMTGIRASNVAMAGALHAGGRRLARARTFSDVPAGACFWYENSLGLIEIAANQGNAAQQLGLSPGKPVSFSE